MSETKQIFRKGNVIFARAIKSKQIACDTTLTKLCEKIGIDHTPYRQKKYPFVIETEHDTYHLVKMRASDGFVNDIFPDIYEPK